MSDRPAGTFVVSIDFELGWGEPGGRVTDVWRRHFLGERAAIAGMLALFQEFELHVTWAIVGLLFFADRGSLRQALPERRPIYADPALSPYPLIDDELGAGEDDDPLHFAQSVVRTIRAVPHQEVGTHTFSHYYCLEPGQDPASFAADLDAAHLAARHLDVTMTSLVFPMNQANPAYLPICAERGITAYRGTTEGWAYAARPRRAESRLHRVFRLLDAYLPLSGSNVHALPANGMRPVNVPASRLLRPVTPALRSLEPLRLRRILGSMRVAATRGGLFHLWWHPHNFGLRIEENIIFLRRILDEYRELQRRHGMVSRTMAEVVMEQAV
jgi:hypothetical protein